MSNFVPTSSSRTTFAPACALVIATMLAAPVFENRIEDAWQGFSPVMTQSSYTGSMQFSTTPAPASFEERLGNFYSALAASQVNLDQDIEQILIANVSSLYED